MSASQRDKSTLNVLVADDEEDVLEVFRMALEPKGHRVTAVTNGPAAVECASAEHFDVAFLDVAMAPVDGLSTLSRLKTASPQTKVIMITAFYSDELSQQVRGDIVGAAMRMGAKGCLRKPFELDAIVRTAEYFGRQGVAASSQASSRPAPARPRVIVAGDEDAALDSLARSLQSDQWELVRARDPEEALTSMRHQPASLIVCDEAMASLGGGELLALVARQFPNCVRVLLTEAPDEHARSDHATSAHFLVAKPWQEDQLGELVREALLKREQCPLARSGSAS